jgi:hypothetical protein
LETQDNKSINKNNQMRNQNQNIIQSNNSNIKNLPKREIIKSQKRLNKEKIENELKTINKEMLESLSQSESKASSKSTETSSK